MIWFHGFWKFEWFLPLTSSSTSPLSSGIQFYISMGWFWRIQILILQLVKYFNKDFLTIFWTFDMILLLNCFRTNFTLFLSLRRMWIFEFSLFLSLKISLAFQSGEFWMFWRFTLCFEPSTIWVYIWSCQLILYLVIFQVIMFLDHSSGDELMAFIFI